MSAGSSPGRASVHERRARLYTGPDGPNDPPPYAHNTGRRVVYQRRGDKGLQGAQGWRRKKPRRRGTVRKAVWPQTHSCKILWWNARGLADDIDDLLDVMEREQVTVAVICETKSYGDELSRRGFTFLRGPETLPKPGMACQGWALGCWSVTRNTHMLLWRRQARIQCGSSYQGRRLTCMCVGYKRPCTNHRKWQLLRR